MAVTERSFGKRRQALLRLPVDHYEYYDSLAEEENLDLGPWLAKQLAESQGLPVPEFVGRHQRRKRHEGGGNSAHSAA